jgi:hypothetical protein
MSDTVTSSELEDERDFLLRSLQDLEREHQAGDLGEEDYRALRDSYTVRTAAVLRALEDVDVPTDSAGARRDGDARPTAPETHAQKQGTSRARRKVYLVVGAVAVFAVVAAVLVATQSGARLPGETISGGVTLSAGRALQRTLDQAETLEQEGNAPEALQLYRQVLAAEPDNVQALSEAGWLEFEAGVEAKNATLLSDGQSEEQRAERAAPTTPVPHLYLGSMLLVDGDPSSAVPQYAQFVGDGPSASEIAEAKPFIDKAYTEVGRTPPVLPAA